MYIRVTGTPNSPRRAVKVVESIRDGYTVRQVIVKHIGIVSDESQLEKLKQLGQEYIAQEQLRREAVSGQQNLFDETLKERLEAILRIPLMSINDSERCRSLIPIDGDQRFQSMPIKPEQSDA